MVIPTAPSEAQQAGFTLIEVLLTLALLLLVGVTVFQAYSTAIHSSARATSVLEQTGQLSQLRSGVARRIAEGATEGELALEGRSWSWEVTDQQTRRTVAGFDAERLQLTRTDFSVGLSRAEVQAEEGGQSHSFHILTAQ